MNTFIWMVQLLVAFVNAAGGAYKIFQFDKLAAMPAIAALPKNVWTTLGGVEVVCAVLLVLPALSKSLMRGAVAAALLLALENAVLTGLFVSKGGWTGWNPQNPAVWTGALGVASLVIAAARSSRH